MQVIQPKYSLYQIVLYFFKLGCTGFGGPVALIGYMHRDLVAQREWITEADYKEGLALAQLAPGPLAAQLGIYLGYVHYGILGATLCGLAFVIPSFIMVVLLGMAYVQYNGLAWMQAVFYGVGAAVIGIISMSSYKLTTKTISNFSINAIKQHGLLWTFFGIALFWTIVTQNEEILLFLAAGLVYMFYKSPPKRPFISSPAFWVASIGTATSAADWNTLGKLGWFFTKAGAFVFGSGLAIVPFLHAGVVNEFHWLSEKQFLDAVAVAMITPGPVVITVGFIGYLVGGFPGACVAALATFLPCYLLTILPAPYFRKIAQNTAIKAFVEGITAAVVGALVGAVVIIASRSIVDVSTAAIAIASVLILIYFKKIQEPLLILLAAFAGILLSGF